MTRFTWRDEVIVRDNAPAEFRPSQSGSVIGVMDESDRFPDRFPDFPPGNIYLVEFASDEQAIHVHEDHLRMAE